MLLICHVITYLKGYKCIYGWKDLTVSHHRAVFGGCWSSASGVIKYLICYVA